MKKSKKQIAKLILSSFSLILLFSTQPKTTLAANNGHLDFNPSTSTIYVGEEFDVQVTINSDSPADAVDAFFTYPASNLEILNITPGPAFQAYPGIQYNSPPGQVKITGFSVGNSFQGSGGVIATLRLKATAATPDAWIKYDFTLQNPPITTDSNIAKNVTSEDILKSVGEAHFQLIPDNRPPYTTNWTPAPNSINVPRNTNISFHIKDDERGVNINSVSVNISGKTYNKNTPQFSYSGSKNNYFITINPTQNFNYSQSVNVKIDGTDIDGNTMSTYNYSFKIGDEPPKPNIAPTIVSITPVETTVGGQTTKTLEVVANDPDAPNTDLKLSKFGVPSSAPFIDNGNGTGVLDYTNLPSGNYFVVFTATDKGTPNLSGSDGTWLMISTQTPPPPTPQNHAPRIKPITAIETTITTDEKGNLTNSKEITMNIEATDSDNDPITLSASSTKMKNFTFTDNGNGTGTLKWTPQTDGLFSATFTAEDTKKAKDQAVGTISVKKDKICPTLPPAPKPVAPSCPSIEETLPDKIAAKLPDELIVSRAEAVTAVINKFKITKLKFDKLNRCEKNIAQCLLIFKNQSKFNKITTDLKYRQLFPDVPKKYKFSKAINTGVLDGIVTGYYGDKNSPFKPDRAITRVEAIAMALRGIDMVPNLYYDELSAILGGKEKIKSQKSKCSDVNPKINSQWWYSRYLNKAIEIGIIDKGKCRPEQFLSEQELVEILNKLEKYIEENNYTTKFEKDSDSDLLKDIYETKIFGTNPKNPDSDGDGLNDYDEIITYKTNALKADTDNDGLTDREEILTYKTNPLIKDTDGDGFTDKFEIDNKLNAKDKSSTPNDVNKNSIDDTWEKKYNLFDPDPTKSTADQDNDNDGLSNKLEFIYGTHPLKPDTDKDGISDSEETLIFKTNPNKKNKATDVVIQVTNLTDGQTIADRTPTIQGIGPAGIPIMILARNEFGHEIILGKTTPGTNNVFVFEVPIELQDGEYFFFFKVLDKKTKKITTSPPVRIIINPEVAVQSPIPTKLDNTTITNDVILNNIRIEVINNRPTLIGNTDVGNQVIAIWKSVVFTSALIADSATGSFEVTAPKELPPGEHKVFIYAVRPQDQTISETVSIPFEIKQKPSKTALPRKTAIPKKKLTLGEQGQALFIKTTAQWPTIIIILSIGILGYVLWTFIKRKKNKKNLPPHKK